KLRALVTAAAALTLLPPHPRRAASAYSSSGASSLRAPTRHGTNTVREPRCLPGRPSAARHTMLQGFRQPYSIEEELHHTWLALRPATSLRRPNWRQATSPRALTRGSALRVP